MRDAPEMVNVLVSDLNASIRFYTQTLGLKLKRRIDDGCAEIEAPGMIIVLQRRPGAAVLQYPHFQRTGIGINP